MRQLGHDILPSNILERSTKAAFIDAFWGPATRRFARTSMAESLGNPYIKPAVMTDVWRSETPHAATTLALQTEWLRSEGKTP
jgi:hypothetical protein